MSAEAYSNSAVMELFPDVQLPEAILRLTLKRIPTYFVMNVIIPSALMTSLSVMVFWLPYESGEKVSLGIAVLSSFFIVLLMISDVTPRNGNNLPILCEYRVISRIGVGMETPVQIQSVCLCTLIQLVQKVAVDSHFEHLDQQCKSALVG